MRPTLSVDLRERILTCYDEGKATRDEVAQRFVVSLGMVKKLLQQRRRTGDVSPRHRFSGRKPKLLAEHKERLRALVTRRPDLTLAQLRAEAGLECTLPTVHNTLVGMGLTLKKRRFGQPNSSAQT